MPGDLEHAKDPRTASERSLDSYLRSMERLDQAIREASDLEQMMRDVLDVVLDNMDVERAWLLYPCDPAAVSWRVPMERTRPRYPGAMAQGRDLPMTPEVQAVLEAVLATAEPLSFGAGGDLPMPEETNRPFQVKSQLIFAIYPKLDKPWVFGVHQCSRIRHWYATDKMLFKSMGRRIGDALGSLLLLRDLRRSEGKFRSLFESAPDGILVVDLWKRKFKYCNPALQAMFGYSEDEIRHLALSRLYPQEALPRVRETFESAVTGSLEVLSKVPCLRKDGTVFWADISPAKVIYDNTEHLVGFFKDVSGQKLAEDSLRESEERFRVIFNSVSDCIFIHDAADGSILDVNARACATFGYSREEFLHLGVGAISSGAAPFTQEEALARIQRTAHGRVYSFEWQCKARDGRLFWAEVSATRARLGDVDRVLVSLQDITRSKQNLERLSASLHDKEVLLKEVHHRVKNNLQIISSLLHLQADHSNDPLVEVALSESQNRVRSMAAIHEELYTSKNFAEIDLEHFVKFFVPRLTHSYKTSQKNVAMDFRLARIAVTIDQAIPFALILNELVTNALKHGLGVKADGRIEVDVSIARGVVTARIRDNGRGLPQGFDLDQVASLGINLVKTLTEQLHGAIRAENDGGAVFTLTFPLAGQPGRQGGKRLG